MDFIVRHLKTARRYFDTLRYLQARQILYRIWYLLRRHWRQTTGWKPAWPKQAPATMPLQLAPSIQANGLFRAPAHFAFLNLEQSFSKGIDWEFAACGKLWTYNLHYFEWLCQADLAPETGLQQLRSLAQHARQHPFSVAWEPYPVSLRLIFSIRFLTQHRLHDDVVDAFLKAQLDQLGQHKEYHLSGNHLLENGFGLLFGAYYFQDKHAHRLAQRILKTELQEQILNDGAHFERSPMYHQLLLYRLLDAFNLLRHNPHVFPDTTLLTFFESTVRAMFGWMHHFYPDNNEIPRWNDSTPGIAPSAAALLAYAGRLFGRPLAPPEIPLSDSGYRRLERAGSVWLLDVGPAGPDYIPGHAHCDMLAFEWRLRGRPVIVHPGISTYEKNEVRQSERSTASHNTVQVGGFEQSEVWGGFRLARRARAQVLRDDPDQVLAAAQYWKRGVWHTRSWQIGASNNLTINDKASHPAVARFHFHPGESFDLLGQKLEAANYSIQFDTGKIRVVPYQFCLGFNRCIEAACVEVFFEKTLRTTFNWL